MSALFSLPSAVTYPALFFLVLAESGGLPVPGESSIMVASLSAARGSLSIPIVLAVAIAAAIIGDNLGYLGGRLFGRRIWLWGSWGRERRRRWLDEGDRFLDDHGALAVAGGRWLPVTRFTVAWLAGINRMPWRSFFLWNAVGGVTWVVTVGLAAYYIGHQAQSAITAFGLVGLLGLVIALIGHGIWTRRASQAPRRAVERRG
ncbi:MAG TPA: DedA family protein [Gaiellales bacterium]|nr:DedA family protein [Gaiellales bacterium]